MYEYMNVCVSSFLCFCFYENLQELNRVKTRMNEGRNEFLFFWRVGREESLSFLFLRDRLVGLVIANKLES